MFEKKGIRQPPGMPVLNLSLGAIILQRRALILREQKGSTMCLLQRTAKSEVNTMFSNFMPFLLCNLTGHHTRIYLNKISGWVFFYIRWFFKNWSIVDLQCFRRIGWILRGEKNELILNSATSKTIFLVGKNHPHIHICRKIPWVLIKISLFRGQ